jgi:hypothetical protein
MAATGDGIVSDDDPFIHRYRRAVQAAKEQYPEWRSGQT